ncbi:MAG: saccharopine dehydrogenase [Ignavibacteria bacterium GWF2_33_9]|nr:MAG: saccharopine dehydrogenase [Ignavibacteria bacterium GWF2_33_9]
MKKVIILGCGMVGRAMALDMSENYDVTSCDISQERLDTLVDTNVKTKVFDFNNLTGISELVSDFDLVISAVPGFMGFNVVKEVIISKKNIVDISFFAEDSLSLDEIAKENGVTAVVDCGVAPGMCNVLLGYHYKRMQINSYLCYVGGLPFVRDFPFQYKAPFSPIDVIEEYTRPARYVENSVEKVVEPLSDPEFLFFEGIGTLEAFNTDGIRTLIQTVKIPNIKEKTLRYPQHIEYIKVLKEAGFFSKEEIEIDGVKISPVKLTNKLLFDKWKLNPEEAEFTVMRVFIEGNENNRITKYIYDLFDIYDVNTQTSSMARTTGYTATAVADLILKGEFNQKGIIPPEYLGFDENTFSSILDYLELRNINYEVNKI